MQFDSLGVCSAQEAHLPGEGERVTFLQEILKICIKKIRFPIRTILHPHYL